MQSEAHVFKLQVRHHSHGKSHGIQEGTLLKKSYFLSDQHWLTNALNPTGERSTVSDT